jgi:very-short-patch-repair endonuclease
VVTRAQLMGLGFNRDAINHRVQRGRLHRVHREVYALGTPELTLRGHWNAAVLTCGPGAALSHLSAAALWGIVQEPRASKAASSRPRVRIDVSVPMGGGRCQRAGLVIHRRRSLGEGDVTRRERIRVTSPIRTLIDIATMLEPHRLERAVNEADRLSLTDPERLRAALAACPPTPGVGVLKKLLDERTFLLTDSELERRFLPIARKAGLEPPLTRRLVNGYRVDFYWPRLGLVVETDGLTYHRTPAQQSRDRERDQAHTAAGLTSLRFTHAQIRYEPERVIATLEAVVERLRPRLSNPGRVA